ncbi:MAG: hypothetical protein HRU06_18905 [Oceanospirillaceae bacterium]|nr:hypothetical protein [Oceanospirillaceae bacterium]
MKVRKLSENCDRSKSVCSMGCCQLYQRVDGREKNQGIGQIIFVWRSLTLNSIGSCTASRADWWKL